MKKLPSWVRHVGDGLATLVLLRALWVLRTTGMTWATVTLLLALSFFLMRLSFLVVPRKQRITVVETVRAAKKLEPKRPFE